MARRRRPKDQRSPATAALLGLTIFTRSSIAGTTTVRAALRNPAFLHNPQAYRKPPPGGCIVDAVAAARDGVTSRRSCGMVRSLPGRKAFNCERGTNWKLGDGAGYGAAFGEGGSGRRAREGANKGGSDGRRKEDDDASSGKERAPTASSAVGKEGNRGFSSSSLRRMRQRAKAKIKAMPAVLDPAGAGRKKVLGSSVKNKVDKMEAGNINKEGADDGGEPAVGRRRSWGPGAVGSALCSAVFGRPVRFFQRRVDACKSFVASRERVHWASLAMATYIVTTSVVPRLAAFTSSEGSQGSTGGGVNSHHNNRGREEDSARDEESSRPYGAVRTRRGRRRHAYTGGYGDDGDMPTLTHLDDHAEELWRNSPAVRAAAAAASAAAAAAEDSQVSPAPPPRGGGAATSLPREELRQCNEEAPSASTSDPVHGDAMDDGVATLEEGDEGEGPAGGIAAGGGGGGGGSEDGVLDADVGAGVFVAPPPDLRTHTDLGDLELAAEKALDLLSEEEEADDASSAGSAEYETRISSEGDIDQGQGEGEVGASGVSARGTAKQRPGVVSGSSSSEGGSGGAAAGGRPSGRTGSARAAGAAADDSGVVRRLSESASVARGTKGVAGRSQSGPRAGGGTGEEARGQQQQQQQQATTEATGMPTTKEEMSTAEETAMPTVPLTKTPRTARIPAPDGVPGAGGGGGGSGGGTGSRARHSTSFVAVAARAVSPAVCRIDMERLVGAGHDTPFPDVEVGQGSGVIFSSEDGLVLTNAHVVAGARKVTVTLTDGRKFLAEVKGADELSDLAVLKIDTDVGTETTPLPAATLGDSQDLEVGDWVIAVGNPVGLDSTVTLGIVSSMKRSSEEVGFPNRKVTFIQTDAAINPGNSGGPLVNEFGEVVGINTAIRAHTEGIGFAIPINKAKAIMYELAEGNRIEYAYIGIHMTTITPDYALQNNRDPNSHQLIPEVEGAIIVRVLPDTPAADAGLRRHDVVIEMGGRAVRTADEAKQVVDESSVGDVLMLKVMRGVDRFVELEVKARDMSEQLGHNRPNSSPRQGGGNGNGGPNGPRSEPRPYPGAPPPAFPWGGSPQPPASTTPPSPPSPAQ